MGKCSDKIKSKSEIDEIIIILNNLKSSVTWHTYSKCNMKQVKSDISFPYYYTIYPQLISMFTL